MPDHQDATAFAEFLRRIPKTDLHFHLLGAVRPQTVIDLAIKHVVELPSYDPEQLYKTTDFEQSLEVLRLLSHCVLDVADFSRIMYEALQDAATRGNGRHIEVFFNPTVFQPQGVSYAEMLEGLEDGIERAQRQFGITSLLIPSIDREKSPRVALQMVKDVIARPSLHVAGIGMDFAEGKGMPGTFACAYQLAGQHGLMRTAHVCESNQPLAMAPPHNVHTCLVDLGCDRLDHGYNILADAGAVAFAKDRGVCFCVCPPTAVPGFRNRRAWTIEAMRKAGLKLTLNTDDPWLYGTDLEDAWVRPFETMHWGVEVAREFMLNGIDASWVAPETKVGMRKAFSAEFESLQTELLCGTSSGPTLHQSLR
jgi:adenosine deaminase